MPFSGDQLTEIKEAFAYYDKNGDGFLEPKDIEWCIRACGFMPGESESKRILKHNKSKINFEQFLATLEKYGPKPLSADEILNNWRVFDKDGNGELNVSELRHMLTNIGEKLTEQELEALVTEGDDEGTGHIMFKQFVETVTTNMKLQTS